MNLRQPLHTQIYSALAERIRTGEWAEGDQLPSEKVLIEEFGTSRGPVRQALARLRSEGLIVGGRGAPPRIQKTVPSQPFNQFLNFNEWAEELGYVPRRKTIEVSRKLADEDLAERLQIEAGSLVVAVSRMRTFDDEPVLLEYGVYPFEWGRHLLSIDLDENGIYDVLAEHGIVATHAHNVIDAVVADEFAAYWLGIEIGAPLLRIRRISYDQNGRVTDCIDNRYLPSKVTFAIDNSRDTQVPIRRVVHLDSDEQS